MDDKKRPVATVYAKRKDAPKGVKGHAVPVLAVWEGREGMPKYATLDDKVAFVMLTDGTKVVSGRDGEHWLNVYDKQPSQSPRRAKSVDVKEDSDWKLTVNDDSYPNADQYAADSDDSIPF